MPRVNQVETETRRIAVILGPGNASRYLLDRLRPLLAANPDIELQGMFLREANVQHAAELPFVKELCRVTFTVREFNSDQFERALALRMRTARQALALIASRAGVPHTFRDVRGSAVRLLRNAVSDSDITVFEPTHLPVASAISRSSASSPRHRIGVVLRDFETGRDALRVAVQLAEGNVDQVNVLLMPSDGVKACDLRHFARETLPGEPGQMRLISEGGFNELALCLRELVISMLVAPASGDLSSEKGLQFLRQQIRCPVCLVRQWDDE